MSALPPKADIIGFEKNPLNRSGPLLEILVKWHQAFQSFLNRESLGRLRPFDDKFVHLGLENRGLRYNGAPPIIVRVVLESRQFHVSVIVSKQTPNWHRPLCMCRLQSARRPHSWWQADTRFVDVRSGS